MVLLQISFWECQLNNGSRGRFTFRRLNKQHKQLLFSAYRTLTLMLGDFLTILVNTLVMCTLITSNIMHFPSALTTTILLIKRKHEDRSFVNNATAFEQFWIINKELANCSARNWYFYITSRLRTSLVMIFRLSHVWITRWWWWSRGSLLTFVYKMTFYEHRRDQPHPQTRVLVKPIASFVGSFLL